MNTHFSLDLIRIDLNDIKTLEDCKRILFDNNINEKDIVPQKVFEAKESHQTLFFDAKTLFLIAFIRKGKKEIMFTQDFTDIFSNTKSITQTQKDITELTLDSVLDKINSFGFKSLTSVEKEFLNNSSKR